MRITTGFGALVAVVLFAAASLPAGGQSGACTGAGCPDSDFGTNGIVRLPSFGGAIGAIAIQNIAGVEHVVALKTSSGAWKLTRYHYTPEGDGVAVDTSFGVSGSVSKTISSATAAARYVAVVQPDNQLMVVGSVTPTARGSVSSVLVVRYTADGQEQNAFTFPGSGLVTVPRQQSDGKVVMAVPIWAGQAAAGDSAVLRFTETGALDTSFGGTGIVTVTGVGTADALAIQPVTIGYGVVEEKIVLCTTVRQPDKADKWIANLLRLNADGTRDWTFSSDGEIRTSLSEGESIAENTGFNDLAVDRYSRIVAAGSAIYRTAAGLDYHVLAARFDATGHRDPGFASGGLFVSGAPSANIQNVAIGPDGGILLVGYPMPTMWNARGLVVWRLLDVDGTPDPSFGAEGLLSSIVTVDPMSSMWPAFDTGPVVAFTGDGSTFLVGGSAYSPKSKRVYAEVGALGRFLY